MRIQSVRFNNRKKAFEVRIRNRVFMYPYARLEDADASLVREVQLDPDLGNEGFSYRLSSGKEGTIHAEQVLDYNEDPDYVSRMLLYKLTLEAQARIAKSSLSKREIIRRLGTSATQYYRLLDQTNSQKSFGQMFSLLHILDCHVDFVVTKRKSA